MRRTILVVLLTLAAAASPAFSQPVGSDEAAVRAAIRGYHHALAAGDIEKVKQLLAADAVILEGGSRETRDEYLAHHLQRDIDFAKAVPEKRGEIAVRVVGDVAWASAIGTRTGNYRERPVHLATAELVVLRKTDGAWIMQSIHWSSRPLKTAH